MKKILIIIVACFALYNSANGQNVVIQNNEGRTSSAVEDNVLRINGIPATEDIGGVSFTLENKGSQGSLNGKRVYRYDYKATNYNNGTVTVLCLIKYDNPYGSAKEVIISKVIGPNQTIVDVSGGVDGSNLSIQSITRKLQ